MKLASHVAACLPLGLAMKLAGAGAALVLVSALSSVLIDLDHIPDYLLARRGWRGIGDFFATCERVGLDKLHFVLHGWEWPILLAFGLALGLTPPLLAAVGLGLAYHLLCDSIGNRRLASPLFYWFSYRAYKGFATERLLSPGELAAARAKARPA